MRSTKCAPCVSAGPDSDLENGPMLSELLTTSSSSSGSGCEHGLPSSDSDSSGGYPERRKQQARLAARSRRSAEAGLFQDLGLSLPVSPAVLKSLDKLAVLRVAVCYVKLRAVLEQLRLHSMLNPMQGQYDDFLLGSLGGEGEDEETDAVMGHGFLIVMTTRGEIIYVSENVSKSLRCDKYMILGTNINDYVHRIDHDDIGRLLTIESHCQILPADSASLKDSNSTFFKTRRKSTIVSLRSGQSLCLTGKIFFPFANSDQQQQPFFIGVGEATGNSHPLSNDFPFTHPHFKIYTELDWVCSADVKFVRGDVRSKTFLGYKTSDLIGVSAFDLVHPLDLACAGAGLKKMFVRGDFQTPICYRLLVKGGGWAWFMTQMSMVKIEQPVAGADGEMERVTFCVGRHFMVSDVHDREQIFAPVQLGGRAPPRAIVHHFGEAGRPLQMLTPPDTPPELQQTEPELQELAPMTLICDSDEYLDELMAMLGDGPGLEHDLDVLCGGGGGDSDSSEPEPISSCRRTNPPNTVPT